MDTAFIVNPTAGNGKAGRRWAGIERLLREKLSHPFRVDVTKASGHATILARRAVAEGIRYVVSVGGEGTLNEVVNGLFPSDHPEKGTSEAVLGILGLGSSNDLIKTLGWKGRVEELAERLNRRRVRRIDVGRARYTGSGGRKAERLFVNVADFGAGGAVVERVNRTSKRWGGTLSFLWGIVVTLLTYQSPSIAYRVDGQGYRTGRFLNVIVANGRYYGGGILAAPHARLDSGDLSVVFIRHMSRLEALGNLPRFHKGTHLEHPKIHAVQTPLLEARARTPVPINLDGEHVGTLPVRFDILPRALRLLA